MHQARLIARGRLSARAKLGIRLASIVALATGGLALGHTVVGIANSRTRVVEVAGVSVVRADAPRASTADTSPAAGDPIEPPVFTSSLRWSLPPAGAGQPSIPPDTLANPAASPPPQVAAYTVEPGDTLTQIADRYAVAVDVLAAANHLPDMNVLRPGVQLLIPMGAPLSTTPQPSARPADVSAAVPASRVAQSPNDNPARAMVEAAAEQPAMRPIEAPAAQPTLGPVSATVAPDASTPEAVIRTFYALVEQGQFEPAAALWSQRMRSAYPPAANINSRFADTTSLTVTRASVVDLDLADGRATVAVSLSEVVRSQPATRHYVGSWYLVRGPGGWLLDQPSLQPG